MSAEGLVLLSGEIPRAIRKTADAMRPEPCIVCGAFPPARYSVLGALPGSPGAEQMVTRFGAPDKDALRVVVYFVCAAHSRTTEETREKIIQALFARGLN